MLTELGYSFLCACQELVVRQQELLPFLAAKLGIKPETIYYDWVSQRFNQVGRFACDRSEWKYFFHGLECDLKNCSDGRFVRVDFGPGGTLDTFSGFGVLQFVMTSKPPWQEFHNLRMYLADKPPPFNEYSGSHRKMEEIFENIVNLGFVEVADLELYTFVEKYTTQSPSGGKLVSLPPDTSVETVWDSFVCDRWILSDLGQQTIAEYRKLKA